MNFLRKLYAFNLSTFAPIIKEEKIFSNIIVEKMEYIELIMKSAPVYNKVYWNIFMTFYI